MSFERFTKAGKTFQPKVSIRKGGQMGFNNGSRRKFKLDDYEYVILYFDKENSKVGIQLTNDDNENGIIKLYKRELDVAVSAKSFLDYYEISCDKTVVYDPQWVEEQKMIILDLKNIEER